MTSNKHLASSFVVWMLRQWPQNNLQISRLGASLGSHRYPQEPGLAPKRLMNNPVKDPRPTTMHIVHY
jgi:hypothetical protein